MEKIESSDDESIIVDDTMSDSDNSDKKTEVVKVRKLIKKKKKKPKVNIDSLETDGEAEIQHNNSGIIKNNDSFKTDGSTTIPIDEQPELVHVEDKYREYKQTVDFFSSELPDDVVQKDISVLRKKWLEDVKINDPVTKILKIGMRNMEIDESDMTMETITTGYNRAAFEIFGWFNYFFKHNKHEELDPDTQTEYCILLNKMKEMLWYTNKTIRNAYRMKVVLDPEYDSSMNDDIGLDRFKGINLSKMTDFQQLYFILATALHEKRYRRYGDFCYKQVFNEQGKIYVFVETDHVC